MLRIKDRQETARWFRALGDEMRLRILERLSEGEQCVCDLTDALEAGQSLMSFHLRTLKDAGLLRDRREGRWVYYSLDPATIASPGMDGCIGGRGRADAARRSMLRRFFLPAFIKSD